MMMACMRRAARPDAYSVDDPLVVGFTGLRQRLAGVSDLTTLPVDEWLTPFLEVIRSETTTGPITEVALAAVNKFLRYGLIDPTAPRATAGLEEVADAVTHAKFVRTDLRSDEVVLVGIVQVLHTLLLSPVAVYLSNESVCELMHSCFRVYFDCFEHRLSELLRRAAVQSITDMIHHLFSRLELLEDGPVVAAAATTSTQQGVARRGSLSIREQKNKGATATAVVADAAAASGSGSSTVAGNSEMAMEPVPSPPAGFTGGEEDETALVTTTAPGNSNILNNKYNDDAISSGTVAQNDEAPHFNTRGVRFAPVTEAREGLDGGGGGEGEIAAATAAAVITTATTAGNKSDSYGVPCLVELLKLLLSLSNPRNPQNTETMVSMSLSLLTIALETGGHALSRFDALMELIGDGLCYNLFGLLRTHNLQVFAPTLRILFTLFEAQRGRLKFQLGYFLDLVMTMEYPTFEHREGVLDCIQRLCRLPGFAAELFLNFDCNLHCEALFSRVIKFLSQSAFPEDTGLYLTNVMALDALLAIIAELRGRPGLSSSEMGALPLRGRPAPGVAVASGLPLPAEIGPLMERKRILLEGVAAFNKKPKKGIAFLQEAGLLSTPVQKAEVARFLRDNPGLSKTAIGEYVGHKDNTDMLRAFTETFEFAGTTLDEGLRQLLTSFRLPGESQIIERIVETYAAHWLATSGGDKDVRDADAAFILSFAIVLLNSDQHNPKNKKPMTLAEFKHNQRGLNGGENFPPALLEQIYSNIHSREIILPEEQDGEVKDKYEWGLVQARWRRPGAAMLLCDSEWALVYDQAIFQHVWGPAVAALSYVFDTTTDSAVVTRAVGGFRDCAALCARFDLCDVFDNLVVALCKRTGLAGTGRAASLNRPDSPRAVVVSGGVTLDPTVAALGGNPMAQLATETVFALAREHGSILREGWKDLLGLVRVAVVGRLLPESSTQLADFCTPTGYSPLWPAAEKGPVERQDSMFSALTGFFASAPEPEPASVPEDHPLRRAAVECIERCELQRLFSDSKMLETEVLLELLKALMNLSGPRQGSGVGSGGSGGGYAAGVSGSMNTAPEDGAGGVSAVAATTTALDTGMHEGDACYSEEAVLYFLEVLGDVVLKNKDRAGVLWQLIAEHYLNHLMGVGTTNSNGVVGSVGNSSGESRIVERAIVGLLRAGSRLMLKEGVALQVFASLGKLLTLPERLDLGAAIQIAAGVRQIVGKEWLEVERYGGWPTLLGLLRRTCVFQEALSDVVAACTHLINDVQALNAANYGSALHLALSAAAVACEGVVPRPYVTDELAVRLLSVLAALHAAAAGVFAPPAGSRHWALAWQPLLQAMAGLCMSPDRTVRQSALSILQRSLLLPDLEAMAADEWRNCLENVLFPLLDALLTPALALPPAAMEETRMRCCTLLCKVFLQHLTALLSLEDFTGLWLRVLDYMDRYMHAGQSELLAEAIPESLKNMLLVMSTAGIFGPHTTSAAVEGSHSGSASNGSTNAMSSPSSEAAAVASHQSPGVLWDLTWERVATFLPGLHDELFPGESRASGVSHTSHSAVGSTVAMASATAQVVPSVSSPSSPASTVPIPSATVAAVAAASTPVSAPRTPISAVAAAGNAGNVSTDHNASLQAMASPPDFGGLPQLSFSSTPAPQIANNGGGGGGGGGGAGSSSSISSNSAAINISVAGGMGGSPATILSPIPISLPPSGPISDALERNVLHPSPLAAMPDDVAEAILGSSPRHPSGAVVAGSTAAATVEAGRDSNAQHQASASTGEGLHDKPIIV